VASMPGGTPPAFARSALSSSALSAPAEKVDPRVTPALQASSEIRDMVYRLRSLVQEQMGLQFFKFDALCYRKMSVASSEEEPQIAQQQARALERSANAHLLQRHANDRPGMRPGAPPAYGAPPTYFNPSFTVNYFDSLHSQQPRHLTTIYFVKVDAGWMGGSGLLTLRIRMVPPARWPLGTPAAIPPMSEKRMVLEGITSSAPSHQQAVRGSVEQIAATMNVAFIPVADSADRMQRTNRWF